MSSPAAFAMMAIAAIALSGCSATDERTVQGYVEGTFVLVSAEAAGRLAERPVKAGDRVIEGALLAVLDESEEKEDLAAAEARLAQARAELANLQSGKRAEEIGVVEAQVAQAKASLALAEEEFRRATTLRQRGIVAQSVADDAKAKRDTAEAQLRAAERELDVARLPARPDEIEAAERNVSAQAAALASARIRLEKRRLVAPSAGQVEETYYEPGELVSAGQPVISLLPDANRKIRFYLPEPELAHIKTGDRIAVSCDGCAANLEAVIDRISTEAEFAPPILYSRDNRDKLVFLVEARPSGAAAELKAGQPVDVRLVASGAGS